MITTIPFSGFYESMHSGAIDDAEAQMFQNDQGDSNPGFQNRLFDIVSYGAVFESYSKAYAENFATYHEIDLKFESLSSPREYNFTTDRIFCEISFAEVQRIDHETDPAILRKLVKERFTSRDGFSSFYSPRVEEWGPLSDWGHNQIGTLIAAFVGDFDEWSLIEDMNCNGEIDNWICDSVQEKEKPALHRLFRIHDYLRHREERNREWYFHRIGQKTLPLNS